MKHTELTILLIMGLVLIACGVSSSSGAATPFEYYTLPTAASTIPELIQQLSAYEEDAQIAAAYALGDMGAKAEPAVQALIQNLQSDNSEVKIAAMRALGKIGATEAIEPLSLLLNNSYRPFREEAIYALAEIGDPSVVPLLAAKLYDSEVADSAARAIEQITGKDFPDFSSQPNENGVVEVTYINVDAAKEWWEKEGIFIDWENLNSP